MNNKNKKPYSGLGTALITPFLPDGNIDYSSLSQLIESQIAGGVDYLVVLGTTAENATLTPDERHAVSLFVRNQVAGRLPLVLGLGSNNTSQLIHDVQTADLQGYCALLSVCPFYNKPSQEGLFRHFSALALASPLPVLLYNVPGRTGVNLLPETVMRIYNQHPDKIAGIKEASGNMEQICRLIKLSDGRFSVISGDDALAFPLMQAGADGLISVASNAFPEDFGEIVHNRHGRAESLQTQYSKTIRLLFAEGNPCGIKTVLNLQGKISNTLRLPLVPNSIPVQQAIADNLHTLTTS